MRAEVRTQAGRKMFDILLLEYNIIICIVSVAK